MKESNRINLSRGCEAQSANTKLELNNKVKELFEAVRNGDNKKISELLNEVDINSKLQNDTALSNAIMYGKSKTVSLLLEKGASTTVIDRCGSFPLHYSCD